MWIHGNVVQVQYPGGIMQINRYDYGAEFFALYNTHENWFHFPMPTPVIIDDSRPKLVKVFVFYNAVGNTKINELRVYDGPRRVKAFENLNWSGDHGSGVQSENSRTIDPPETIFFGLGISVRVTLKYDLESPRSERIVFTSAGADFKPSS